MPGLMIDNEQLADRLRRLAAQQNLSVEDLLMDLVEQHQSHRDSEPTSSSLANPVERLRKLACERARRYWRGIGDEARAGLTDEQMVEQFLTFDENDIPHLGSEETDFHNSPLARLTVLAREAGLSLGDEAVSSRSDEILQDEFADYLLDRMNRRDLDAAS